MLEGRTANDIQTGRIFALRTKNQTSTADEPNDARMFESRPWLAPLPRGEGRAEGALATQQEGRTSGWAS